MMLMEVDVTAEPLRQIRIVRPRHQTSVFAAINPRASRTASRTAVSHLNSAEEAGSSVRLRE
jgi:hypothetical protein